MDISDGVGCPFTFQCISNAAWSMRDIIDHVNGLATLDELGCLVWVGSCTRNGCGKIGREGRTRSAHRYIYEKFVGPVPEGLELDHLCRNRKCILPSHLEPVTHAENMRRGLSGAWQRNKTHCPAGHSYTTRNSKGYRRCGTCDNEKRKKTHCPKGHPFSRIDVTGRQYCGSRVAANLEKARNIRAGVPT